MNDPLQIALAVGLVAAVLVFGYINRAKFERQQERWQSQKPKSKRQKGPDGRTRRPQG